MSYFQQFFAGVILLLTFYIFQSYGIAPDFKKCRGVDIDMAEEHTMHMNACLKKAGTDDLMKVEPSQMACFGKCVFIQKALLDDAGHPHKENLKNFITEKLPKEVHDDLNGKLEECLHQNITELIDPEDESCTTYVPMMMCIHLSFMEECEKTS